MGKPRNEIIERMSTDPSYNEGIEDGRVSVLSDFDDMCMADAFVGFTSDEWKAVRKFFAFNRSISK